jgi:hypothetical protein
MRKYITFKIRYIKRNPSKERVLQLGRLFCSTKKFLWNEFYLGTDGVIIQQRNWFIYWGYKTLHHNCIVLSRKYSEFFLDWAVHNGKHSVKWFCSLTERFPAATHLILLRKSSVSSSSLYATKLTHTDLILVWLWIIDTNNTDNQTDATIMVY